LLTTCGITMLPLVIPRRLGDYFLPLYVTTTNVNSSFVIMPTKMRWSHEPSFLQERRHQEKDRLEQYLVYEENAIGVRKMHHDK
jgi:hypothetical protein